jgi:DNA-directed RNA polymerase II subunit RPB1
MTCHCTYAGSGKQNDCPGHFGHIELAKPVYHVGYIDQVVKLLRCVCFHCSRLMVDRKKAKRILTIKDPETRSRHLHEHCRNKRRCEISEDSEDGNQMDTFMKDIGEEQDEFSSIRTCGGLAPRYTRKGVSIVVEYPNEMQDIPGTGQNKQSLSRP